MRFTPFILTLMFCVALLLLSWLLRALDFNPELTRMVSLWSILFLLAMLTMGVTRIGMQFFGPAFCHGSRKISQDLPPIVALTFDDGPDAAATPALLALLAGHQIKATFFCTGSAVRAHPAIARAIIEQGHLLENHTDSHHWSVNFANASRWRRELHEASHVIEEATGHRPTLMRPPLGLTNPHLHKVLRELKLTLVGWDVRSFDTLGKPVSKVIARVTSRTRPGSIVLLHDGKHNGNQDAARVCAIADGVIHSLKNKGFSFVRIDEMMHWSR